MHWPAALVARLRTLLRRGDWQRDIDEEVQFHVDMQTQLNLRAGLSETEARRQALLLFGGVEAHKEGMRDAHWQRAWSDVAADVRYALRTIRRAPVFAVVAVLTLGLGIGANSGLYGLIDALFFRPPPGLADAGGLVRIEQANRGSARTVSRAQYQAIAKGAPSLAGVAASWSSTLDLAGARGPVRVHGALVSGDYFALLGPAAATGRTLTRSDDAAALPLAVLGHSLWQREYGGDREIVGRNITVNGASFSVVGVAPEGFAGTDLGDPAELWIPLGAAVLVFPASVMERNAEALAALALVGRLRAGATAERVHAELQPLASALDQASPHRNEPGYDRFELRVDPLRGWLAPSFFRQAVPLVVFAWVVTALVLLVACANLANVLLARSLARRRELAIRIALGVRRGRLVRLLLAETMVLAVAGAVCGLFASLWAADVFQARLLREFGVRLVHLEVTPDLRMFLFTLALTTLTALACGLFPALRASRLEVSAAMKGDRPAWLRPSRLQAALVVAQVTLSTVLLFTGGIFVRQLRSMSATDPGYATEDVLSLSLDLRGRGYTDAAMNAFFDELRERVQRIPGVIAATAPASVPLGEHIFLSTNLVPTGTAEADAQRFAEDVLEVSAGPDYFRTLEIPLLQGRAPHAGENAVVVSASVARRYWPGEEPIGRTLGRRWGADTVFRVVGVAGEIVSRDLRRGAQPHIYVPARFPGSFFAENLLLRVRREPADVLRSVRAEVRRLDPSLPLFDVRTLEHSVQRELEVQRAFARTVAAFGAIAALLAALGLHGVIALLVQARVRDMGIRRALGATGTQVVMLCLDNGMRMATLGIITGSALSAIAGLLLGSIIPGTGLDAAVLAAVAAGLLAVALLSVGLAARRAAGVSPLIALRAD